MNFNINFVAVLVAALAPMVIGFAWYSKILFGKAWMKLAGVTDAEAKADKSKMPMLYGTMFLASVVMAFVLSQFENVSGASDLVTGASVGFLAWLGFVATTMLTNILFERKPFNYYLINAGYQLVSLVVMGAILVQLGV